MIPGLLAWLLLLGAAAGLSAPILRPHPRIPPLEYLVLRVTLGLAAIALLTLGAGALGWFRPAWFWTLSAAGILALWLSRRDFRCRGTVPAPRWLLFALGAFFLVNLFYSLFPPTFHDSMVYHLAVPAHYIRHGGLAPWPTNFNASLPLPVEMIYTFLLLGGGLAAVRPFVLTAALGLALLLLEAGADLPPRRRWLPVLLFFTIPQVGFLCSSSKTDIPGMLFLMAGVSLLRRHLHSPEKHRWRLAAGFALGTAVAAKYTALFFILPALAAAIILEPRLRRRAGTWLLSALAAALCLVPWWIRNTVFTGDPVYPYLTGVFPSPGWSRDQALDFSAVIKRRQDNRFRYLVTFPVAIFLRPYHYGMTAVMGFLFLFFLPGLLRFPAGRDARLLWFAGLSGFVILLFFARAPRYFLPGLLFLSVPAVQGMMRWIPLTRPRRFPAALGLGLCLAVHLVLQVDLQERYFLAGRHTLRQLSSGPGAEYLDILPYHRAARFARRHLPADARVAFLGEDRSFYFPGDPLVTSVHDRNPVITAFRAAASAGQFADGLRRRGITHVLYCPGGLTIMGQKSITYRLDAAATARLENWLSRMRVEYLDRRYFLLALPQPSGGSSRTGMRKTPVAG